MAKTSPQFEGLLDGYFELLLAENPAFAATAGIESARGRLGNATPEFEARWQKIRRQTLAKLDLLSPRELSNEQHLDRLALRSQLLRECEDFERGRHTLDPGALDQVLNLLLRELQRGEDEPRRVAANLRSLLKVTPRYLAEAATLIDRPERVWRNILEQTAAGAGSLFEAVATFLKGVEAGPSDAKQIAAAQKAFARMDSVGQQRMSELHQGSREKLEISPNLWAGVGLVRGGAGTALVGDADTVAERMREYIDAGIDTFILSGYPHLEEAYRVAELVLPRLPLAPATHAPRTAASHRGPFGEIVGNAFAPPSASAS